MESNKISEVRGANYRRSFWFGVALSIGSLIARNPTLWIAGFVFLLYGLVNRSKWPQGNSQSSEVEVSEDKTGEDE